MSSYTVHYQMKKGATTTSSSQTVNAESEATAIRIVEDGQKSKKPGYDFILKEVKTR